MKAFKEIKKLLISLRRYCWARYAEVSLESEFAPRTESLNSSENISLLMHHELIHSALEEIELFVSKESHSVFKELSGKMCLGFNVELAIAGGASEEELNAKELYLMLANFVDEVLNSLYCDLGFEQSEDKI